MSKALRIILITIVAFGIFFVIDKTYFGTIRTWLNEFVHQLGVSHIITYLVVGIPVFTGVLLLHGKNKFFESLGLDKSVLKALLFSILCTLPMFIGYAVLFRYNSEFSLTKFLVLVLAAGIFEELYFRGFLFGQIYRYTHWGFIPSVITGATLFGLVHLYQGTGINELAGIFLITFLGGILYAWVYVEWNYNLWVPIFLHLLMNLSWGLFSAGSNALGGMYSNIFRAISITLIIVLTIRYKKKTGQKLDINKKTIWMKKENPEAI